MFSLLDALGLITFLYISYEILSTLRQYRRSLQAVLRLGWERTQMGPFHSCKCRVARGKSRFGVKRQSGIFAKPRNIIRIVGLVSVARCLNRHFFFSLWSVFVQR